MAHRLSSDLREAVAAHAEAVPSCQHAAAGFGNSVSFTVKLMTLWQLIGGITAASGMAG